MRRKTRKALIHLSFFGGILFLIIILNRPQSSSKTFAWTTIRYKTSSPTLPESRGICPGLAESIKPALVVSRVTEEDSTWLDPLADLYHLCIYTADAPANKNSPYLQVPENRGHEAMAYLTFLIDNYAHMPAAGAVFVHGSRWAWHNDSPDYDNAALLAALNISSALEPWGYHNLRCDWSVSTCVPSAAAQGSLETSMSAILEPWSARSASDAALPRALASLFGGDDYEGDDYMFLGRGDAVRSQCCAQFVVARDRIWQHSRAEYVALRQWLLDGSTTDPLLQNPYAAPRDDRIAGRILSYVWHILFVQQTAIDHTEKSPGTNEKRGIDLARLNVQACPRADDCYCRLYGRCDLPGCSADSCYGQYHLPSDYKVPARFMTAQVVAAGNDGRQDI